MKNNNKVLKIASLIFAYTPIVVYAILFTKLPDEIPMHFNSSGEVDRFGSRLEFLLLPIITIFIYYLMIYLPKIDPKKANYEKFHEFYFTFQFLMVVFFNIIFFITLLYSFGYEFIDVNFAVCISIGLLFMIIGNYMPRAKQNFYFGVKTPWTLSNEKVWTKTHRLAGYLFVINGLLFIISAFISGDIAFALTIAFTLISTFVIILYSYLIFKKID